MGKDITGHEFEECLHKNKIVKFPDVKASVKRELKAAQDDLKAAIQSLSENREKWATIQAYYSMFHTARALLYSRGYREKSHYCLIVAMKALFVTERVLDVSLVEAFQMAKTLRENADYDEYSKKSAESLVDKAKEFLTVGKKILKGRRPL
ncbi:MAG: HEPN domain-containing protein [Candidatus Omnitrophica bacterium]|nr:HEPN domain-containing protein [Candidatus Omnitrophota bacterium]